MTEFTRNTTSIEFKNDDPDYELFHATLKDHCSDLILLVSSPDQETKVMIPTHKSIMVDNLKYFECMFREGSNWQENKEITDSGGDEKDKDEPNIKRCKMSTQAGSQPIKVKLIIKYPKSFAEYIKSIYDKKLNITPTNCHLYLHIADYLQDTDGYVIIEKYLRV